MLKKTQDKTISDIAGDKPVIARLRAAAVAGRTAGEENVNPAL